MNLKDQPIKSAPFPEISAVTSSLTKNPILDIVIDQEHDLENYCFALLDKIFTITQSQFPDFINHQICLMKEPVCWLNKFEKLLANNEDLFSTKRAMSRFNKLYSLIEKNRTELQRKPANETPKRFINAGAEDRHFSFYEVKLHIYSLENFGEKILYLTEEIFEYRQADIISLNSKLQEFDKQCEHLIEKLQTMKKMRAEFEKERQELFGNQSSFSKLKINCNVNQLADVFYQLHRELFSDGKPIIDGNINDIAAIIVNSFVDKDGKEISPETVKTILTPSRADKRPKPHKRLDVDKMLG